MDDDPFLSFNILDDDEELFLSSLEQFHKANFNIKEILSKAVFLKYVKVVEQTLKQDLISPSDELVKYFLSRPEIKTGNRITTQIIEKHRAATAEAMRKVMGATINNAIAAPAAAVQPETIGDKAVTAVKSVLPSADCTMTEKDGVYSIDITDGGVNKGTFRVSDKLRVKCDYFGDDKSLCFFGDIDRIKDLI